MCIVIHTRIITEKYTLNYQEWIHVYALYSIVWECHTNKSTEEQALLIIKKKYNIHLTHISRLDFKYDMLHITLGLYSARR